MVVETATPTRLPCPLLPMTAMVADRRLPRARPTRLVPAEARTVEAIVAEAATTPVTVTIHPTVGADRALERAIARLLDSGETNTEA